MPDYSRFTEIIPSSVWRWYPDDKRLYHNSDHIRSFDFSSCPTLEAAIAAALHDAGYDPTVHTNEETACKILVDHIDKPYVCAPSPKNVDRIKYLIMSTKDHVKSFDPNDLDMVWLHQQDLAYFIKESVDIATMEKKLFYEFQHIDFETYVYNRKRILTHYKKHPLVNSAKIDVIINHLNRWKPNIGLLVGSFNPFHIGHTDVLTRAETLFDKVIVAQGHDRRKPVPQYNITENVYLKNHETIRFDTDIFTFIRKISPYINLTIVRGIRNGGDLTAELEFQQLIKEHTKTLAINIFTDPSFAHISSSMIRQLDELNVINHYKVL